MAAANPTNDEKLTVWQKLGYGVGDIFGGGSGTIINFFYLVFLTDVVQINPGLAGTVILISKIYDAITDPLEGVLSDRTRTKMGRRRPYLLAGIFLVFISFFTLFYPVTYESELARFAFVIFAYLFFSTIVSIVLLNYNALQAEMTLDYNERTSLTTFRIFFSSLASILCAVLPLEIVNAFSNFRTGWTVMAAVFGLFFALPFIATVATARERPEFQKTPQPFHWRQAFIEPFLIRTFVYIIIMYVTAFAAFDAVSSIVVFYVKNYLGRGDEVNFVIGGLLVAQMASLPFYEWLSKRASKPKGYMFGAIFFVLVMFFSFLITPTSPSPAIYVFAVLVGLGSGGVVMMVYAIFPDIPDVDELQSGERREGIFAAITSFTRKIASALAVFTVGQMLALAGYVPPLEQAGRLIEQPQSDNFILVLRVVFVFLPVLFISFGIFFANRFPLTVELYHRLQGVLTDVRKGDPIDPAEKEILIDRLIR